MKTSKLRSKTSKANPSILLIGVGGIGGITAAHIARKGYNIEVVDVQPGLAEKISTCGIHVLVRKEISRLK